MTWSPRAARLLVLLVAAMVLLTACTTPEPPRPTPSPGAAAVAEQLAMALSDGSIEGLPIAGDAERAVLDHEQATGTMGDHLPRVKVGEVSHDESGTMATVRLNHSYPFPGQGSWSFTSSASLEFIDGGWQIRWSPQVVHPSLTPTTRLYHERTPAKRGPILGAGGVAIVEDRPVYRVGIDKTLVAPEQVDASARALAALLGLDAEAYAAQASASGPQAFVLAVTLREGQVPPEIGQVPGAAAYGTTLPLAPSPTFARGLLGSAGEATAEVVEAADGAVQPGEIVGLSGLQQIHDEQLRGAPGHAISIIRRSEQQLAELPPPSPSPGPSGSATPAPAEQLDELLLFAVAPINGEPLQLTLDLELQRKAEQVLAGYGSLVMLVILDRQTGAIRAAANSPAAGAQSFATTGRYPPGSTMKVVTSLALLRKGLTPDSLLECSPTAEVNGRVFTNYPGYPAQYLGQITMRTALRESCNTAFMNAGRQLGDTDMQAAAASLGIGVDYPTGFDAFYGSVPVTDDPANKAAGMIGQGEVVTSPMAMAAEAASAAAGHTVVPYLVEGQQATPTGAPLTEAEAAMLRDMMDAVVSGGTLLSLHGILEGGKSGTAEYTNDVPPKVHEWVVGYSGAYAVAAMDYEDPARTIPQDVIKAMLA